MRKKKGEKYTYEKVVEEAERVKDKFETRASLLTYLSRKFELGRTTLSTYLYIGKFSKSYPVGEQLQKYWEDVKSGRREEPGYIQPTLILKFMSRIMNRPTFSDEFERGESSSFITCRNAGILVRRFKIPHLSPESYKRGKPRDRTTRTISSHTHIYFFEHQKKEAYNLMMVRYSGILNRKTNNIKKIFGIKD